MTASVEVDKTGASYYGEQTLHYLATNGETAVVQLREYCNSLYNCTLYDITSGYYYIYSPVYCKRGYSSDISQYVFTTVH